MSATITGEVLAVSGSIRIQSNPISMKLLYHRKQCPLFPIALGMAAGLQGVGQWFP